MYFNFKGPLTYCTGRNGLAGTSFGLVLMVVLAGSCEQNSPPEIPVHKAGLTCFVQGENSGPDYFSFVPENQTLVVLDSLPGDSVLWQFRSTWKNKAAGTEVLELQFYMKTAQGFPESEVLERLLRPGIYSAFREDSGSSGGSIELRADGIIFNSRNAGDSLDLWFRLELEERSELQPGHEAGPENRYWVTGSFSGYLVSDQDPRQKRLIGEGRFQGPF